jgi:predicted phage terminase large subunit-like protein
MQRPNDISGTVFKRNWFPIYLEYDPINSHVILQNGTIVRIVKINSYSDTALKPGEENDWTVFNTWGLGDDSRIYLLDRIRGKWDSVDLEAKYIKYLQRLKFKHQVNNLGPTEIGVEDKASGIGLIQSVNRMIGTSNYTNKVGEKIDLTGLPKITPIPRGTGQNKPSRALSTAPFCERGQVVIPKNAMWTDEWLDEVCTFSANMTHNHDDQCDPMFDAVHRMLIDAQSVDYDMVVGSN